MALLFQYVSSFQFLTIRSSLYFCFQQVPCLSPLELFALLEICRWCFEGRHYSLSYELVNWAPHHQLHF